MPAAVEHSASPVVPMPVAMRHAAAEPVAVALVGGDGLFREGLKRLFADTSVEVVADAAAPVPTLGRFGPPPQVIVLLDLPGAATRAWQWMDEVSRRWPGTSAVVLSGRADAGDMALALDAGVAGYLLTDMSPAALAQAIGLVALGENVFPTRLFCALSGVGRGGPAGSRKVGLTPREIDILHGLLEGKSNKLIARTLGTTDATVKAQLRHLLRKIGVENRTQAALWAREHGIVEQAH
ncbi:MAG: LuxR C-terminal-related transcriptional regulator [Alphaproteobacteria bacterium]